MKYNQPFDQPAAPNAPYINGNPATGLQGSIPPAAAIEYPQRELVALIAAAGGVAIAGGATALTPDNADLAQVKKTIQMIDVFNTQKISLNHGNASQWSATIPTLPQMPPPLGTAIWFAPQFDSVPGGTVFSVNGSSFAPVTFMDFSPVAVGDIQSTAWLLLFFDSVRWLITAGSTRRSGSIPILTKNVDWYVNGGTGDDTWDGTQASHGTALVGPFKTIQRALTEVAKYNMNGYNQYIHIADGAYTGPCILDIPNGQGRIYLIGNGANPNACQVSTSGANQCVMLQRGGQYDVEGFRYTATGSGASDGFANNGGQTNIRNCRFGPCTRAHMSSAWNGALNLDGGTFTIEAGGNTQAHFLPTNVSSISRNPFAFPSLNILGAMTVTAFCSASNAGLLQIEYTSITGAGNVTGSRYSAVGNSIIDHAGHGTSYLPGTSPGTVATGGQAF